MILTSTQISHFGRYFKQKIVLPKVAVIGGYHGGNLGDMALGRAVSEILNEQKLNNGLQTIYNLGVWPNVPYAIVGGGAVGYLDSLNKVYDRYKADFKKLAFLGVDFNEVNYPEKILEMLRNAAFVSCRSKEQADRLKQMTGRDKIFFHPDIAYSLSQEICKNGRMNTFKKEKKLFVNAVPLYGHLKNGVIIPNLNYKSERPELYENFDSMHTNYKAAIRSTVEEAISNGYQIESLPFTPQDGEYCKIILKDLDVKYNSYSSNPLKMLKYIATGERIISTRFHATIYGLKTGAFVQPIAYAKKNELMLNELGLTPENYLTTTDLSLGKNRLPQGLIANEKVIEKWENESKRMIEKCVKALF